MIRKMLAMLVAISCAFGAWADTHISGTDFTGLTAGPFVLGLDDSGESTGTNYWYNGDTSDFEGTIVTDGLANFLDFESNITNPLYRTINNCYGFTSPSQFQTMPIGTGLFIDTHVQFTPYLVNENHPAPSAVTDDDKLIVWVREIEVENDANLTNLIVTAGYYNNFDEVSESNYVVTNLSPAEIATLCSTTNRLTIKSFSSITGEDDAPAGFVVYINKKSLEYAADAFSGGSYVGNLDTTPAAYYEPGRHRLFPSLMAGDQTNHDKLSGVGYAGMGKIGEVWFDDYSTDYPDFAGDDHNITIVKGEGVVSYVYNNITYTEDYSTAVSVPTVTISNVVYNTSAGYQHKTGTWYIGSQVVNNTSTADGDIGTFDLANGNRLVLAGFKANYLVGGFEYQSLFGIEPTETTGAYNAAKSGGTIKLNKDILIDEGTHKQIVVGEDDDLTIDLNGHTLRGTAEYDYTIVNNLGTLTIIDTSDGQTGKVLGCLTFDGADWVNNFQAIKSTGEYVVSNALTAGTYELILTDVNADKFVISAGSYICPFEDEDHHEIQPSVFYLASYLAPGATVTSWTQDPVTEFWYANVGGSAPTTYAVTFSTNTVVVAEYTTNITAGATLPDGAIPAFTGGAWDVDPTNAVINAATNFNYTIVPSYTLTYATEYGAAPDGVVYTASTPDFALAAAPVTEVVGIQFAGWVIGSVTNEAGATFVVADHLENTTATAAWAPVVPTGTAIYLVMGSGVNSLSTSFNGTDWTAYTDPLQDVELGSTLYIKGTSSVTGYDVPQFSIVVDNTHATEQTALVVNKSAIVYFPQTDIDPSSPYAGRDGTPALPFVIRNYADLVALKNGVANGTVTNQCFEQVADIDMDGEAAWTGIGAFEVRTAGNGAFEGSYDGGNHTIANVTFDQHEYNGIFASVFGGVIKNLTVDVDGFAATAAFGGAAIAGVAHDCYLTNLVATGIIVGQNDTPCTHSAAGIAVRMEGTVAYACTNRCEIWSGKNKVGGIAAVGQGSLLKGANYLTLCSNEGDIHASKTGSLGEGGVGGLFGYQGYSNEGTYQPVTYTDCRNIGQVISASSDNTGSILGTHSNSGPTFDGIITLDGMRVSGYGQDGVTYGKSIGGGLVELCTQAAFETNNTYSTMWSGLTPTFAFEAAGTISFNTNLFQATAFAITGPQGYEVTSSEAGGIVTFTCSNGSSDPWEPEGGDHSDTAVSNKVASIFGDAVAQKVNTYDDYTNMVNYLESKGATDPDDFKSGGTYETAAPYVYQSYILGADPLFVAEPAVEITSLTANATAGEWDFIVKVTEGELTTAHSVAAAKVAALVKVTDSLSPASWSAPDPEDVHADLAPLLGTNLIKVTVDFGTDTSGFMKVSE